MCQYYPFEIICDTPFSFSRLPYSYSFPKILTFLIHFPPKMNFGIIHTTTQNSPDCWDVGLEWLTCCHPFFFFFCVCLIISIWPSLNKDARNFLSQFSGSLEVISFCPLNVFLKRPSISSWVNKCHVFGLSLCCPAPFCLVFSNWSTLCSLTIILCSTSVFWILSHTVIAKVFLQFVLFDEANFHVDVWAGNGFPLLRRNRNAFSFTCGITEQPLWLQEFGIVFYHLSFKHNINNQIYLRWHWT